MTSLTLSVKRGQIYLMKQIISIGHPLSGDTFLITFHISCTAPLRRPDIAHMTEINMFMLCPPEPIGIHNAQTNSSVRYCQLASAGASCLHTTCFECGPMKILILRILSNGPVKFNVH